MSDTGIQSKDSMEEKYKQLEEVYFEFQLKTDSETQEANLREAGLKEDIRLLQTTNEKLINQQLDLQRQMMAFHEKAEQSMDKTEILKSKNESLRKDCTELRQLESEMKDP